MTSIEAGIADDTVLFCPACGYDLRASTDGRCNECGLLIDRASLRASAFPWAYRHEMGRLRAYVRTVWQVLVGSRALAYETVKPQDLASAQSFARVTGALVAVTLLCPFFAAMADSGGMGFLAIPPNDVRRPLLRGWQQDVVVPWAAGATLWPVAALCVVLFGFYAARAARPMFGVQTAPSVRPERAAAIALYATAPLALLPLSALLLWGVAATTSLLQGAPVGFEVAMLLGLGCMIVATIAVVATLVRVGQWLARVRLGGLMTGVAGAVGLLACWVVGAFVLFAVAPWCIGFLWLVFDSLR